MTPARHEQFKDAAHQAQDASAPAGRLTLPPARAGGLLSLGHAGAAGRLFQPGWISVITDTSDVMAMVSFLVLGLLCFGLWAFADVRRRPFAQATSLSPGGSDSPSMRRSVASSRSTFSATIASHGAGA